MELAATGKPMWARYTAIPNDFIKVDFPAMFAPVRKNTFFVAVTARSFEIGPVNSRVM